MKILKKGDEIVLEHKSSMLSFEEKLVVTKVGPNWIKAQDSDGCTYNLKKDCKSFIARAKGLPLSYSYFYSPCKIKRAKPEPKPKAKPKIKHLGMNSY